MYVYTMCLVCHMHTVPIEYMPRGSDLLELELQVVVGEKMAVGN